MPEKPSRIPDILDQLRECPIGKAATILGHDEKTVRARITDGRYPSPRRARVDVLAALEADREAARTGGSVVSIETARLKRMQADAKEMDNLERAGVLISREEIGEAVALIAAEVANTLDTLPNRVAEAIGGALNIDPRPVVGIIEREADRIRSDAAAKLSTIE